MGSPPIMMVDLSLTYVSPSAYRIKRKPPPTMSLEERYPPPDNANPFATLADLRRSYVPDSYKEFTRSFPEQRRPSFVDTETFKLQANQPSPSSRLPVLNHLEGPSKPSRPPRSPFRNRPYGNRSFSASNLLKSIANTPTKVQRHISHGDVEFTTPEYSSEDKVSPIPSLVADVQSDSSEGDPELPSPKSDTELGPDLKRSGSKKMFRRFIGKKSSNNAPFPLLIQGEKMSTWRSRRHSAAAAFSSPPSSPTEDISPARLPDLPEDAISLQNALAKLNGTKADHELRSQSHRTSRNHVQGLSESMVSASLLEDKSPLEPSSPSTVGSKANSPLSLLQFTLAACIPVVDTLGSRIPFADLINVPSASVLFIRHWNCLSSQAYVCEILPKIPRGQKFIIVGNGSHAVIPKYRKACDIPDFVEVYAEPSLRIHRALGMGAILEKDINKSETKKNSSLAKAVVRALKSNSHYGPVAQLGGEFHFTADGNNFDCTYAHRMETTKDHGPIEGFIPSISYPLTFYEQQTSEVESEDDIPSSSSRDTETQAPLLAQAVAI